MLRLSPRTTEAIVLVLLITAGAGLRLYFRELPNFAPVAALALFAGYFFRHWSVAVTVPLSVMAISDLYIGPYSWYMMLLVYGMLTFPVALRPILRRHLSLDRQGKLVSRLGALAGLLACGVGSSVLFFVTTNFGSWLWFGIYDRSLAGLVECYLLALPFFRYTLAGDLLFAVVLFGSYACVVRLAARPLPAQCKSSAKDLPGTSLA